MPLGKPWSNSGIRDHGKRKAGLKRKDYGTKRSPKELLADLQKMDDEERKIGEAVDDVGRVPTQRAQDNAKKVLSGGAELNKQSIQMLLTAVGLFNTDVGEGNDRWWGQGRIGRLRVTPNALKRAVSRSFPDSTFRVNKRDNELFLIVMKPESKKESAPNRLCTMVEAEADGPWTLDKSKGPFAKSQRMQLKHEQLTREGRKQGLRGKALYKWVADQMAQQHFGERMLEVDFGVQGAIRRAIALIDSNRKQCGCDREAEMQLVREAAREHGLDPAETRELLTQVTRKRPITEAGHGPDNPAVTYDATTGKYIDHRAPKPKSHLGDPTKEEMMAVLDQQFAMSQEDRDDAEVAIYYFAERYHGGQSSNLYSVLSTSPFRPGPMASLEKETENVRLMYDALASEFGSDSGLGESCVQEPMKIAASGLGRYLSPEGAEKARAIKPGKSKKVPGMDGCMVKVTHLKARPGMADFQLEPVK